MKLSIRFIAAAALLLGVAASAKAQNEDVPKAQPTKAVPTKSEPTKAKPVANAVRPLSVKVELVDAKTSLRGTLTDTTTLAMKTSFGVVQVPLSEVAGFRFPSVDDATTTVVMLNGDSITGATDVKMVTVETEWGVAQINGQSIQSILFVPALVWSASTGLNGKRWALSEPSKPASNPPRSSSTTNGLPSRVTRPAASTNRPTFQSQPQFGNQTFNN